MPSNSHASALRILDANFNRASEAARVIEDWVRFGGNDAHCSQRLKQLRHQLAECQKQVGDDQLIAARDSQNDVGRGIANETEMARANIDEVLQANLKRLQQALRSIEESSKTIDSNIASTVEQLRYESYSLEKLLLVAWASKQSLQDDWLMVLIDGAATNHQLQARVEVLIEGGVRLFQLRDKQLDDRDLLQRGRVLSEVCREHSAKWIFNDRADLASLCGADGVHLGQEDISISQARTLLGAESLIGCSTHSLEQAVQAAEAGANYIGMGPVFPSRTKAFEEFVGLPLVETISRQLSLPAFAIGGIDLENADKVFQAGATRIAVSSLMDSNQSPEDVGQAIDSLKVFREGSMSADRIARQ